MMNVFFWFDNFFYFGNLGLCGLLLSLCCELELLLELCVYIDWWLLSVLVLVVIVVVGFIVLGVVIIVLLSIWVMCK